MSSKLVPCEEPPLVTPAVASALFAAFLALLNRVLIVVPTVAGGGLVLTISITTGSSVVAAVIATGSSIVVAAVIATGRSVVSTAVVVVACAIIASVVVVARAVVVITISANGEVNSIIYGSTLGNWYNNPLVIRGGSDRREPICTSRKAAGDISSKLAVGCNTVQTLEESKDARIRGLRRAKGWNRFNDDVVVSNNLPGVVQLLRRSEVGGGCVGEVSSLHPLCVQDNSKCSVGVHISTIGRELELAGRHIVDTRNITHRCRVTRAALNLQAVCDRLADTEVDKVVGADEGVGFACS